MNWKSGYLSRCVLIGSLALLPVWATANPAAKVPQADKLVLEMAFDAEGDGYALSAVADSVNNRGRALDNRSADRMGGNNQKPGKGGKAIVKNGSKLLSGASSMTISGWYRSAEGDTPANFARLLESSRVNLFFDSAGGNGLVLSLENKPYLSQDAAFRYSDRWIFFAVTFDGTKTENNMVFYAGSLTDPVREIASFTTDVTRIRSNNEQRDLVIGNVFAGDRPFKGLIDGIYIWADKDGGAAALGRSALEDVRELSLP